MTSGLCNGRVVIVTGGARGIGREHCLEFARQGARVVVNDLGGERTGEGRSSEPAEAVVKEIRAMGGEAVANGDDVSDWDGAKRMIDQAISTFGGLDVLVSNAGILRDRMLTNMTIDEWDSVIKVHLRGTFCPAHHAANYWRAQVKEGKMVDARIINTTSVSGLLGNQGQCNYGAAKAGIAAFTITAAMELARYGITVNAISPGALTRMTEDLGYAVAVPEGEWNPRDPANIAPVVMVPQNRKSKDVTGQVFESTGGRLTVFERWHRGPAINPKRRFDPVELGPIVRDLLSKTRPPDAIGG